MDTRYRNKELKEIFRYLTKYFNIYDIIVDWKNKIAAELGKDRTIEVTVLPRRMFAKHIVKINKELKVMGYYIRNFNVTFDFISEEFVVKFDLLQKDMIEEG